MDRTLIFFLKYPERGACKTRLARAFGDDVALRLYDAFVRDMLATCAATDARLLVCLSPAERLDAGRAWLEPWMTPQQRASATLLGQEGEDLGLRMQNALSAAFERGAAAAALVGADLPDLPAAILAQAFSLLETRDVVLGPATDGGYYCVGMKPTPFAVEAFASMPWSTPRVFEETRARLVSAGRSVATLPAWSDIDTREDLEAFLARRNARDRAPASYAAALACLPDARRRDPDKIVTSS